MSHSKSKPLSMTFKSPLILIVPIIILSTLIFLFPVMAQDSKPILTLEQKLSLYQSRDRTSAALSKVQSLPLWADLQKAQEAQRKANEDVANLTQKLLSTPEGKDYQKAANDQQALWQSVLKGVDQSKWKLNPPEGKGTDYDFSPVVQAKPPEQPAKETAEKK